MIDTERFTQVLLENERLRRRIAEVEIENYGLRKRLEEGREALGLLASHVFGGTNLYRDGATDINNSNGLEEERSLTAQLVISTISCP